jgi:predicted MFS family arabinose efflux permease
MCDHLNEVLAKLRKTLTSRKFWVYVITTLLLVGGHVDVSAYVMVAMTYIGAEAGLDAYLNNQPKAKPKARAKKQVLL